MPDARLNLLGAGALPRLGEPGFGLPDTGASPFDRRLADLFGPAAPAFAFSRFSRACSTPAWASPMFAWIWPSFEFSAFLGLSSCASAAIASSRACCACCEVAVVQDDDGCPSATAANLTVDLQHRAGGECGNVRLIAFDRADHRLGTRTRTRGGGAQAPRV